MTDWYEADTKKLGENHIITQFSTLQASNFTMTQNVLNIVHYISANHMIQFFPEKNQKQINKVNMSHLHILALF